MANGRGGRLPAITSDWSAKSATVLGSVADRG